MRVYLCRLLLLTKKGTCSLCQNPTWFLSSGLLVYGSQEWRSHSVLNIADRRGALCSRQQRCERAVPTPITPCGGDYFEHAQIQCFDCKGIHKMYCITFIIINANEILI